MPDAYSQVDSVIIVGGGELGLVTGLVLREYNRELDVRVIDDLSEEPPQVGKGTFSYICRLMHQELGLNRERFVREVKPVFKASTYFKDWCGHDPFHVPFDNESVIVNRGTESQFSELYYRYKENRYWTPNCELVEQRKTPFKRTNGDRPEIDSPFYGAIAYHLGTERLIPFLRTVCEERGVELVDDRITAADVDDTGWIQTITGDGGAEYEADLYVDATSFNRTLFGELDVEFNAFDFNLDSAVVGKAGISLDEIYPATVVETGDNGWMWQIDTYDNRNLGYVYSSSHTTQEAATDEFLAARDEDLERDELYHYTFDTGYHEQAWVGNCVAMGAAYGFVEPLQATGITVGMFLGSVFAKALGISGGRMYDGIREFFDEQSRNMWEGVYEYIAEHYRYAGGDTEFWQDMRAVNPDGPTAEYEAYQARGFNCSEITTEHLTRDQVLFSDFIYYYLYAGLGVPSEFYEALDCRVDRPVVVNIDNYEDQVEERVASHLSYEELYTHPEVQ